jgi:N-acetylmuramic acid 6-phosphate etherase
MITEGVDPRFEELDAWPLGLALEAMWDGQMAAVAAVRSALPAITAATQAAADALGAAGRLVYVGAGTSGRVAVQDGIELAPTFNWPRSRLIYALAGGDASLTESIEGAEDDAGEGARQIDVHSIGVHDVVIGVAASGTTPFTIAAIMRASERGAVTIGIACNAEAQLLSVARYPVLLATGSEVLSGSTRMKAGTAQKAALNLISTGVMLRLGRVYKGLMVDMQAGNIKLKKRAVRIVMRLSRSDEATAAAALEEAHQQIKLAVLIASGWTRSRAQAALSRHGGNLRLAIGEG